MVGTQDGNSSLSHQGCMIFMLSWYSAAPVSNLDPLAYFLLIHILAIVEANSRCFARGVLEML